jgi:hypothetical protein
MDMIATRIKNRLRSNWIQLKPVRAAKVVGSSVNTTHDTSGTSSTSSLALRLYGA